MQSLLRQINEERSQLYLKSEEHVRPSSCSPVQLALICCAYLFPYYVIVSLILIGRTLCKRRSGGVARDCLHALCVSTEHHKVAAPDAVRSNETHFVVVVAQDTST